MAWYSAKIKLVVSPRITEIARQLIATNNAVERLCNLAKTPNVEIFVAGPANRNAKPAPGETPFTKKIAIKGVALDAQTYSGIPNAANIRTCTPFGIELKCKLTRTG